MNRNDPNNKGLTKEELENKYLLQKLSTHEIAAQVGVKQVTVWRWLKKYNIPARTYKENKMPTAKGEHLSDLHKNAISIALTNNNNNWMKGIEPSEHPKWKGGKRIYRRLCIENTVNFCCQICGQEEIVRKKTNLHAHHIDHNRGNNKIQNLVILCASCHKKVHLNLIELVLQ